MAQRRGSKKLTAKQKRTLLIGAAVVGAFLLWRRGAAAEGGADVELGMEPARVGSDEAVSVSTYREIAQRRPGMTYVPTQSGDIGSQITLRSPNGGMFTRNFVREGNQLWAEIK